MSKGWKPLPKDPGPGTLQGKVPPIQSIMPPGATEEEVIRPKPENFVKPATGLEKPPAGKGGSKSAN
jgi:hypothetical protein